VEPWSAVAVGPVVLWYVPQDLASASMHITPVDPSFKESVTGFRFYTVATAEVIVNLRRRATMRIPVPKTAATERWEASQPFILVGEPGSGKTTLAKGVYLSVLGAERFAAVHPVAVEQEIDLVAFTGCANYAHDGAKVPDQAGHLDVVTHENGVLLIDEVHTLDDNLRKHLIDILTEWTFRPRGDNTRRKPVRGLMVFATNRPEVIRDPGRFPHDLFARMGGEAGIIELPPLRQRRGEIAFLARAVLSELEPEIGFSSNAVRKILLHAWPLNHWELEDMVREAHSLAATQQQSEILPEYLKLQPVPSAVAATSKPSARPETAEAPGTAEAAWRFPDTVGWPELFQAVHHHRSFARLRDAWQEELGARNAAAVNRRIGRIIRCDRCEPSSCARCFVGALAQADPELMVQRLEQLADRTGVPAGGVNDWIVAALRELVVERTALFNNDAARAAVADASRSGGRGGLMALIATLKSQLSSG
jgi:transcriptional regulator with AAA-type ATPase domain